MRMPPDNLAEVNQQLFDQDNNKKRLPDETADSLANEPNRYDALEFKLIKASAVGTKAN